MDAPSSRRLKEDAETGLKSGQLLGPYQILEPIGAGGMGRVYRARDPKLNRDVALKLLPEAFAHDPDRLARFRREAQVLASLNHPNIGHIYGLEDAATPLALVLELVEGPTLADLIASRGRSAAAAVEMHDVLSIGRQIAEALEAAHEQGVVHRDLKPANVKVRPEGLVKVLDFGLARALDPSPASVAEAMESPTMTGPGLMTDSGVILGTAPYMSPEQARGKAVDKRADIWAFGCVLFEMLTGRRPFAGETTSDTIAAILTRDPDWSALPSATPPKLRALIQRCLEKDARSRLRDIGDARIEIERLINESVTAHAVRSQRRRLRWMLPIAGLGLVALIIAVWSAGRSPSPGPLQYTQITDFADSVTAATLSPDGRMVAFIRGGSYFPRESIGQLYVKLLPSGDAVRLTDDPRPKYAPVFTPDGSRVAYSVIDGESFDTWTVPVLGGQPARMLPNASGLTWMPDGRLLFSEKKTGQHMGIVSATEARADSREIYFPEHERAMAHYSYASPDGKWVLIVEMGPGGAFRQPCRLVPFDGRSLGQAVGPPRNCESAAWSPDGRWMYFGAVVDGRSHLWRQRFPNGSVEQITFDPTEEEGIAIAPDGKSLVTSVGEERSTIWIREEPGERQLTFEGSARFPYVSNDGRRVFYQQGTELLQVDLGSGKSSNVLPGLSMTGFGYEVSSDETEVAFVRGREGAEQEIWLAPLDRRSPPRLVTKGGESVSFGPNGTLIFRKRDGNANYLYRISTDGSGRERLSSTPILNKSAVSPDREWVLVNRATVTEDAAGGPAGIETVAIPTRGGAPRRLCAFNCLPNTRWSPDGRWMSLGLERGRTLVFPVAPGQVLPNLPASGISAPADGPTVPGARVVGPAPFIGLINESSYVFVKTELRRNLFRIQLR
jgi:serine/threonine protein kinase/Tol biopolymer transport system component